MTEVLPACRCYFQDLKLAPLLCPHPPKQILYLLAGQAGAWASECVGRRH